MVVPVHHPGEDLRRARDRDIRDVRSALLGKHLRGQPLLFMPSITVQDYEIFELIAIGTKFAMGD